MEEHLDDDIDEAIVLSLGVVESSGSSSGSDQRLACVGHGRVVSRRVVGSGRGVSHRSRHHRVVAGRGRWRSDECGL